MVFIVQTPEDFHSRAEVEEVIWKGLEDTYRDRGLDQDIPARGEGLTNLQVTAPPLNEEEARELSHGLMTIYFLSVTRDRENKADLVNTCVFMGPGRKLSTAKNTTSREEFTTIEFNLGHHRHGRNDAFRQRLFALPREGPHLKIEMWGTRFRGAPVR